jgi:hypothetical protein
MVPAALYPATRTHRPTRCRSQAPWTEALFRFSGLSLGSLMGLFGLPYFLLDGNSLIGPFGLSPYLR